MRNVLLAASLATVFAASPVLAQQPPAGVVATSNQPGNVSMIEAVQAAARVKAIDKASRTVTLSGPEGRSFNVMAGPEVKNFAQIAVGDEVVVEYVRAVSLQVQKSTGFREHAQRDDAASAKPGSKPAAAVGREIRVVADVIGVDPKKSTITLRAPDGKVVELDVKNPEHFKAVKVGDQVEANYLESVAIAVLPANGKRAGK
ncbi:MAG TPA: hypothetical protein VF096_00615 [Azonexus sp.]